MIRLLIKMKNVTNHARILGQASLSAEDIQVLPTQFLAVLDQGDQIHPRAPATPGKRGKTKQHHARNLLDRLRTHQDAVLAFLYGLDVLFDNNRASAMSDGQSPAKSLRHLSQ